MEFANFVCDVLDYNSYENIKTIRDQDTTQSNIQVSNFVLLNSVNSCIIPVLWILLLNSKCHYIV